MTPSGVGVDHRMRGRDVHARIGGAHAPAGVDDGGVDIPGLELGQGFGATFPELERLQRGDRVKARLDVPEIAAVRERESGHRRKTAARDDVRNLHPAGELRMTEVAVGLRCRDSELVELGGVVANAFLRGPVGDHEVVVLSFRKVLHVRDQRRVDGLQKFAGSHVGHDCIENFEHVHRRFTAPRRNQFRHVDLRTARDVRDGGAHRLHLGLEQLLLDLRPGAAKRGDSQVDALERFLRGDSAAAGAKCQARGHDRKRCNSGDLPWSSCWFLQSFQDRLVPGALATAWSRPARVSPNRIPPCGR